MTIFIAMDYRFLEQEALSSEDKLSKWLDASSDMSFKM